MMKPTTRLIIFKVLFTAAAIVVSAILFLLLLEELYRFIRVREGMASWAALMGLVLSGIAELGFIIYASELYHRQKVIAKMTAKFLRMLALLGWLFVALELFKVWTFLPNPLDWLTSAGAIWEATDYIVLVAGLTVGVGGIIGARMIRGKGK